MDDEKYQELMGKMKGALAVDRVDKALKYAELGYKIRPSEKLQSRIAKIKRYLEETESSGEENENSSIVELGDGFFLNRTLAKTLYPYQVAGVCWMWQLHKKNKGGILGDDMGLGKTIQIIAFITGLLEQNQIHSVLILLPMTLIANWTEEFEKWSPNIYVYEFHGGTKNSREKNLRCVQRKGGVLITTYGMVVSNWDILCAHMGRKFQWDYVILDEGHKIKNASKTTRSVHELVAGHRLVLSGTPLQNNLSELWSLFDFAHQGMLLGTAKTFKMEFENPINESRKKDAPPGSKRLGEKMAEQLRNLIAPYFLRRTKAEVLDRSGAEGNTGRSRPKALLRKNDFVVWVFLSKEQQKLYNDFIKDDRVQEILMSTRSPLIQLNVMKKICDHPRLLSERACAELQMEGHDRYQDDNNLRSQPSIDNISNDTLLNESGKMQVLLDLLNNLRSEGHRTLVFSQSLRILDIIERLLQAVSVKVVRIDGKVKSSLERQALVQRFEKDLSYSVCLLTSQVGGVGLTLTGANRVVIYDPCWNPATDSQAVDRAYRIGQSRTVVVYRFITCDTVEEKIYRRQVFKNSITRQATGDENPFRYFSRSELQDMFTVDDFGVSQTQKQLEAMHSMQRKTDTDLDQHIAFLYSLDIFGISDHDLLFTVEESDEAIDEVNQTTIQQAVERARHMVGEDNQRTEQAIQSDGRYTRNDFTRTALAKGGVTSASGDSSSSWVKRPPPPKPFLPSGSNQFETPASKPMVSDSRNKSDSASAMTIIDRIKGLTLKPVNNWIAGLALKDATEERSNRRAEPDRNETPANHESPCSETVLPTTVRDRNLLKVTSSSAKLTESSVMNSSVEVVPTPAPKVNSLIVIDDTPNMSEEEEEVDDFSESPPTSKRQSLASYNRQSVSQVVESPIVDESIVSGASADEELSDDGELSDIIPDSAFCTVNEVSLVADELCYKEASANRRRSTLHAIVTHMFDDEGGRSSSDSSNKAMEEQDTIAFDASDVENDENSESFADCHSPADAMPTVKYNPKASRKDTKSYVPASSPDALGLPTLMVSHEEAGGAPQDETLAGGSDDIGETDSDDGSDLEESGSGEGSELDESGSAEDSDLEESGSGEGSELEESGSAEGSDLEEIDGNSEVVEESDQDKNFSNSEEDGVSDRDESGRKSEEDEVSDRDENGSNSEKESEIKPEPELKYKALSKGLHKPKRYVIESDSD